MGEDGSTILKRNEVHVSVWVFVASTLFIWLTRVRNVLTDDALSGGDVRRSLVLPVLFVAAAVGAGVLALSGPKRSTFASAMMLIAVVISCIWVVRTAMIAAGDHAVGFIAVHVLLAAVSVLLVWWAARHSGRAARRSDAAASGPAGRGSTEGVSGGVG